MRELIGRIRECILNDVKKGGNLYNMLRALSLAVILLLNCQDSFAQEDDASMLVSKGVSSALQSDYYLAAKYYTQAKEYYLKQQKYQNYLECEFLLLDCLLKSSDYLEYAQRLENLRKFVQSQQSHFNSTFLDTVSTTLALFEIEYLRQTGDVVQRIDALQSLYTDIKSRNAQRHSVYYDQRLIQIAGELALVYAQQGDCENSRAFSAQSISAMEPYRDIYLRDGAILQPYRLLARCDTKSGDITNAQQTFDRMRVLLAEIENKKSQRAFDVYLEIFNFYLKSNNPDSAYAYLSRLQNIDNAEQHRAEILQLTGDYYLATQNIQRAEQAYVDARAVILRQQGDKNEAIATCHLALGKLYLHDDKYFQALSSFHHGLYSLSDIEEVPDDLMLNPPLASLYSQSDMLDVLKGKAASHYEIYLGNRQPAFLDAAWQTIRLGTRFIDGLRSGYSGDTDKSLLINDSYPVFELALALAHEFLEQTGDERWIDSAFILMEESKALNLRDAVLHGQGRRFAGIPDSLLRYENALRQEIAGKERLIREYRNSPHYQESTEVRYINELVQKKDQYRLLIARYERDHPKYYALKHKPTAISISEIRATLSTGQTMLEYFVGDSSIYLLIISATEKQLVQIRKDFPLEEWVTTYRNALHQFPLDKSIESLSAYVQVASDLFDKLIPVVLTQNTALLIIPDGVLGYVSFTSLLSHKTHDIADIRSYDYLLWQHDVSYSYSANLYLELQLPSSRTPGNVLILAPEFNGLADAPALQYNASEAQAIRKLTRGQSLSGPDCTISAFYQVLRTKPFNVLHFATHGSANDETGDASYLVFSSTAQDSAFLYARDLYNLDMPLDLVFLSACETGTGELRRGEGIISLARGFFYAGVQSLVTTLWRVEDSRSASLSEAFYRQLRNGIRKDQALGTVQREYLEALSPAEKIYAHPAYWSALIPVGNMQAIEITRHAGIPIWVTAIFAVSGIIFVGLLLLRWRKS